MSDLQRHRRNLFLLLCAGCILATILFGMMTARRSRRSAEIPVSATPKEIRPESPKPPAEHSGVELSSPPQVPRTESALPPRFEVGKAVSAAPAAEAKPAPKRIYFRANALGENYGKLATAALDSLDHPQYAAELSCDRVHFAAGKGVCLASDRGMFTKYYAVMFDESLRPGWKVELNGIPSRVRVSPSGRQAAITVFLSGHSYTSLQFATQTTIVDVSNGEVLADLEKFSVLRDGAAFESKDFNFWGVTFTQDENRFYATLWSKGKTYLVECDFAKRSAKVVYENVECASLSPDNTRIAYKERRLQALGAGGLKAITWRFCLLDLKTMTKTELGETRSVDDQVEWLDNQHILYAISQNEKGSSASTDIWVLPANSDGSPEILLRGGFSPAIVVK